MKTHRNDSTVGLGNFDENTASAYE